MAPSDPKEPSSSHERAALLEVGRIDRPQALAGEVVVTLVSNNTERLAEGSELLAGDRTLRVVSSRPVKHRWVVRFAGCDSREQAEALSSTVLHAPAVQDDLEGYWVHDLIGATVVDVEGNDHGRVVEVLANPASDLLVIGEDRALVPLRFAQWDEQRRLVVDAPDGLLPPAT